MIDAIKEILNRNNLSVNDLNWLIPHQANMRIISYIACEIQFNEKQILNNIEELGNTGCASTLISLSQNKERIKAGDLAGITVFGGGYSSGAMLIRY